MPETACLGALPMAHRERDRSMMHSATLAFGLLGLFGPVVSILTLYLAWRGVRALEGIESALRQRGGPS